MRRSLVDPPAGVDLDALADRVRYVGSPEHKTFPSFAGPPHPRADATKCDPSITDPNLVTDWLRQAIRDGLIGTPWEGEFPRYAWSSIEGVHYEGRLVNQIQGEYKGYPITTAEWAAISATRKKGS